jgi:predicted aminopeptidase
LGLLASWLAALVLLTGCQLSYIVKSGYHQAQILRSQVPLDEALNDPNLNLKHKDKLRLAKEAKKFGEEKLGLAKTQNYESFVDLKRNAVSYVVSAAPKNELEHHLFSFPIVGRLPYKGFFSESEAREEAKRLEAIGLDTFVRGVTAYSTLGWFNDPILNTMLEYGDDDLVNLILHETTHATIYIKSAADFNERLATFIGDQGTEAFFKDKEGENSQTIELIRLQNQDRKLFSEFISNELKDLRVWYQSRKGSSIPEEERKIRFTEIKNRFENLLKPKLKSNQYNGFSRIELNNARLLNYQTYFADHSDFDSLFEKVGRKIPELIKVCKTLESSAQPEKDLKTLIAK